MDERHLRQIVGGMTDGVILVGTDPSIAWANAPALAMHGVAAVAELGAHVSDYRRRFELRCRNRHKLPEGQYPLERVMAGEAFDGVVVGLRIRERMPFRPKAKARSRTSPGGAQEWTRGVHSLRAKRDHGPPTGPAA